MFLAWHMCCFWTLSSHVLLDSCCCWEAAALHTTRQQQGYTKIIKLLISFNSSSKHIRLISKPHFNSWFVISCTIWSWNPMEPNLCSVQLLVLQMKRTETNWTWSNDALASSVNLVRFIASSVFLKTPFEHNNRHGPRPPTNRRLWNLGVNFLCKYCPAGFPSQRLGAMNDNFTFCSTWSRSFRRRWEFQCEVVTLFDVGLICLSATSDNVNLKRKTGRHCPLIYLTTPGNFADLPSVYATLDQSSLQVQNIISNSWNFHSTFLRLCWLSRDHWITHFWGIKVDANVYMWGIFLKNCALFGLVSYFMAPVICHSLFYWGWCKML